MHACRQRTASSARRFITQFVGRASFFPAPGWYGLGNDRRNYFSRTRRGRKCESVTRARNGDNETDAGRPASTVPLNIRERENSRGVNCTLGKRRAKGRGVIYREYLLLIRRGLIARCNVAEEVVWRVVFNVYTFNWISLVSKERERKREKLSRNNSKLI